MTQVLYGAKGGNAASDLYTVDPATGATSSVGPTGIAITGLAFHPMTDVLYAVTSALSPGGTAMKLYTVNPANGTATLVGSMGVVVPDIAFDSGGTLYGWQSGGGNPLVSIDLSTAAVTPIGSGVSSISGGGISINSGDVAYTAFENNPQHLETVDLGTGVPTDITAIVGGIGSTNAAAFAFSASDILYAVFSGSGVAKLWVLTTPGAGATLVGSLPNSFDALAWGPASGPTPTPDAYGADGANTNHALYSIVLASAETADIGSAVGFAVTGLAVDPTDGTLYGVTSNNSALHPRALISINTTTGVGTFIGDLGADVPSGVNDIAFTSDGTLYGWGQGSPTANRMGTINKSTGLWTALGGDPGVSGPSATAVNSADVLYLVVADGWQSIYTVDKSDGSLTFVSFYTPISGNPAIGAGAFDDSDVLYIITNTGTTAALRTLTLTGTFSLVGPLPNKADALAIAATTPPPPTPPPNVVMGDLPWRLIVGTVPAAS